MQGKLERERESEGLTTEASPYWSRHRRWLTYSGDVWWPVLRERERERGQQRKGGQMRGGGGQGSVVSAVREKE